MENLLKTKVRVPQLRPGTVPRTRLLERFNTCIGCNLVLVSAPAGFGKTTLVAQWAYENQPQRPVAWVSLDESDNDPVRFWSYLVHALQSLFPSTGKVSLSLLHSSQPAPIEPVLTALLNDLSTETEDIILVLDDYHFINNRSIHNGIIFLIEHLPDNLHLVVASRADPPLSLARFRGKGMMMTIGADELRFTKGEAASFFEKVDNPKLSGDEVLALNTRTEGWAVGLMMAALSVRQQQQVSSFIRDFSGSQRYILDYLVEEVLNQQEAEIRNFLLQTSILEKLSAPLCNYVAEHDNSREMLSSLERRNLFLVPLDVSEKWYRYEHLFADFLRHQLGVESGVERVRLLHGRAGKWYEENGFPDDAIDHYLLAREWKKAIGLIKAKVDRKFRSGEFMTVVNWVKKLPEDIWREDLPFCHGYAVALMSTLQLDTADSILDLIETSAAKRGIDLHGSNDSARCMVAFFRRDISRAMELGSKAIMSLPPESGDARSGVALVMSGVQLDKGLLKEARQLLSAALVDASIAGNQVNAFWASAGLGRIDHTCGNLHKAAEHYRQAIGTLENFPYIAAAHNGLAYLLYEWNDLEQAEYHLGRAIELARKVGSVSSLEWSYYEMARIRLIKGDDIGFSEYLTEADRIVKDNRSPQLKAVQAANHVRIAILRNDMTDIANRESPLNEYSKHLQPFTSFLSYIPVRVTVARGHKAEAGEQLQTMYRNAAAASAGNVMIVARLYEALVAADENTAVTLLGEALTMAEPQGYVRTFVDEGRRLVPLLQQSALRGITPEYAGRLLDIIKEENPLRMKMESGQPTANVVPGLLSERETDVLREAAAGLSNREIADKLIISPNTLKTHLRHIYDKLNVDDRARAIARAKELRLL
jgi:LuxR family maltose regulon positive regulatory protein